MIFLTRDRILDLDHPQTVSRFAPTLLGSMAAHGGMIGAALLFAGLLTKHDATLRQERAIEISMTPVIASAGSKASEVKSEKPKQTEKTPVRSAPAPKKTTAKPKRRVKKTVTPKPVARKAEKIPEPVVRKIEPTRKANDAKGERVIKAPSSANASPSEAPVAASARRKTSAETTGSLSKSVTKPQTASYLNNPPPRYPRSARMRKQEGTVFVDVKVSAAGAVQSARLSRSCGFDILDEAALNAVRRWRFIPAERGGVPVAANVIVPIKFVLK